MKRYGEKPTKAVIAGDNNAMRMFIHRSLLVALLLAPVVVFSDSSTAWVRIFASPFTSLWVAGVVILVGYLAYAFTTVCKSVTWKGLIGAWALLMFIGLLGKYDVQFSYEPGYDPPPRLPGSLAGNDLLLRNYIWYSTTVLIGVALAVRGGRAEWKV